MTRKVWLGVVMLATGFTLLVVAGFAAGATSKTTTVHGKTGLKMTMDMSNSDYDYLDPALSYVNTAWQMRFLTDCKLLNYPDKGAPQGTVLQPECRGSPRSRRAAPSTRSPERRTEAAASSTRARQ